jgi:Domain of unknown function (DUF4105)
MRTILAITCLLLARLAFAQNGGTLSDSAYISLWTVEPGNELYSIFGHSAIQVRDVAKNVNKVYNYGTFDFETPNFYGKFMRGQLPYYLNIEPYRYFEASNLREYRTMTEQVLNLDNGQRQRLFDLLETNARDENKFYHYEFFYDNCATRIRDIFQETMFHSINWDSTHMRKDMTMRKLLHEQLVTMPWSEFGIDLVLGTPCDRRPIGQDYMFLPKYLHDVVGNSKKSDGAKLVQGERQVTPPPHMAAIGESPYTGPIWIMGLVALIGILSMFHPTIRKVFDWIFWPTLSLIGVLILGLWFFTEHNATKGNLNLVWAFPLHILFFARRHTSEWAKNYFKGLGMVCIIMLLLWKFLPQQLPVGIIPILVLISVKCLFMGWERVK